MRTARSVGSGILTHNLADAKLQRQPVFALPLMGYVAQQAAHRQGIARLLALAQAQLQFLHVAVGGVVAQGRAIDHFAIEGAAEQSPHFSTAVGPEQVVERVESQQCGVFQAKSALPGRVGIHELPRRAERGDHFAGVLEKVPIPLLRLAQGLLLVEDRRLVERHRDQSRRRAVAIAQRGDVQGNRNQRAVLAPQLRVEAGHLTGRKRTDALHELDQLIFRRGFRHSARAAKLQYFLDQPQSLAGSQNLPGICHLHQFAGMVAEEPFGGGIQVSKPAIESGSNYHGAGRIEHIFQRFGNVFDGSRRGWRDPGQKAQRNHRSRRSRCGHQQLIGNRPGEEPRGNCCQGQQQGDRG